MKSKVAAKGLPPKARVVLLGITLSAIGNGLVLPYLFIYLHNVRGISSSVAGLLIGYSAIVSLLCSPTLGSQIDHWGPKPVLIFGLIVLAIGYSSLALVHSVPVAMLCLTICSIGNSGTWPAQSAILAEITPEALRERSFASSFALLNLGIGIGGLIASGFVDLKNPHSFESLFIGDGFSFIVYLVVALTLGDTGHRNKDQRDENKKREDGWKDVLADRTFVKFWIVGFLAITFGYSQLEVGFAAFSTSVARVSPAHLAWAYALNTLIIATTQLYIVKKIEPMRRAKAMAISGFFWCGSWLALSFAGLFPSLGLIFVIACQIIFSFGEMFWAPVVPSVVNQLAPAHLRGRYNSATGNAWQIAMIIGPSFAGTMLGAHLHWLWIGTLVSGLLFVSFSALRLKLPEKITHS